MAEHPADRSLARFAGGLAAVTWCLLVFGSAVRAHGAGLACPDWPLCFGMVVPPIDFQVGLEFGHRVLAGFISLGFVGLAVQVFRREHLRWLRPLTVFAGVVLATQVVLGGLTVLELLAEWTVASHLVTGNLFTALLVAHSLLLWGGERGTTRWIERGAAGLVAVVLPMQLVMGGLVAGSFAGLACGTWPTCDGVTWFPTFSGLVGLQVMHRILAYSVLGAALAAFAACRGDSAGNRASIVVLLLVCAQVLFGIANVMLRMPVEVTLLHSGTAALIVLSTMWLNVRVWRAELASAPATSSSTEAVPA